MYHIFSTCMPVYHHLSNCQFDEILIQAPQLNDQLIDRTDGYSIVLDIYIFETKRRLRRLWMTHLSHFSKWHCSTAVTKRKFIAKSNLFPFVGLANSRVQASLRFVRQDRLGLGLKFWLGLEFGVSQVAVLPVMVFLLGLLSSLVLSVG